ncbi:hypothetical protein ACYKVK_004416 [Enterobacter hormaechei]|uniref:hypothetical protein n=1 Tax=Enterobacter hormaechei TaxID=158836 RepID=UPI001F4BAB79|nr:hypothetical protein [Enterobacter hormaechei]MDY7151527.1 hypothetical protein [Enterobacter hormaechei]WDC53953.1 hypothetical protein PTC84_06520 [Enterobacter hormaechei]
MSNIDKQAQKELYAKVEQQAHSLRGSPREYQALTGLCPVNVIEMHAQKIQALLDELEAKDSTIATQQQEIRTLLNALGQSSEKRNSDLPDQKRIIGWRASDYTDETSDPELAKNWAAAIGVLPIFEGDVNTKLSAAAAGKGE